MRIFTFAGPSAARQSFNALRHRCSVVQPRAAWIAAAAAGGLAVLIVGVDLALNLEVRLETQREGQWQVVSGDGADRFGPPAGPLDGCASEQLRLTVDNGLPWATDVHVAIVASWFNGTVQEQQTVYDDTWHLDRGEVRRHEFSVPAGSRTDGTKPTADVQVQVGATYLFACVEGS